jgi:lambda family phage minor tail protein L
MSLTVDPNIASDVQKLTPGEIVYLYQIDATALGALAVYYFTPATLEGHAVQFDNTTYIPLEVEVEGFEASGTQMPRPIIRISNITKALASAVLNYEDMLGATLTRIRTFRKYLDGESEANPGAYFPPEVWVFERKTAHSKRDIEWELSAYLDFDGVKLPRRQCIRETCDNTYRIWDSVISSWNYTNVTCPYTGDGLFEKNGLETNDESEDICGRKVSDCKLRFPNDALPFRGFPNISKLRVRG